VGQVCSFANRLPCFIRFWSDPISGEIEYEPSRKQLPKPHDRPAARNSGGRSLRRRSGGESDRRLGTGNGNHVHRASRAPLEQRAAGRILSNIVP
jgi:hypothetical protein